MNLSKSIDLPENVNEARKLTTYAISSLEQEVLKTLLGGQLQPTDIAEILGTEVFTKRLDGKPTGMSNPIITGVLWGLERRNLVKQPNPRDPWEITDQGKKYIQLKGGTNMAVDIKKILKQIDGMDVQELSELVKALEDKFGISTPFTTAEFNVNLDEVDFNNFIIDEVQPSLFGSEPEEEEQEVPEGEHRYFVYAWRWFGDERFAKIGRTRNGLKGVKNRMVTTYHPTDDPVLLGVRECADMDESHKTEQYILNGLERTRPDREWVEIDEKFNEMIDKSFTEFQGN